MKIAICFSGEPRDFLISGGNLLSKLGGNNVDYFVHSYVNYGTKSNLPLFQERGGEEYQNSFQVMPTPEYLKIVKPVMAIIEDYGLTETAVSFNEQQGMPQRMFSMFYGIEKAFKLIENQKYDIIARVRPDLYLSDAIDWDFIFHSLKIDNKLIFIPKLFIINPDYGPWETSDKHVTDLFWVASGNQLRYFQNIYQDQKRLCSPDYHTDHQRNIPGDWMYWSEWFLRKWFNYNNFKVCPLDIKMQLGKQIRLLTTPEYSYLDNARNELGLYKEWSIPNLLSKLKYHRK